MSLKCLVYTKTTNQYRRITTMSFGLRNLALESIPGRIIKSIGLYAVVRECGDRHNFTLIISIYPTIRFAEKFFLVEKHIVTEKFVKVIITTRKRVTVICDLFGIGHHECVIYETIFLPLSAFAGREYNMLGTVQHGGKHFALGFR